MSIKQEKLMQINLPQVLHKNHFPFPFHFHQESIPLEKEIRFPPFGVFVFHLLPPPKLVLLLPPWKARGLVLNSLGN
ncbi:hypothetical protein Lal_00042566, partial [Lupinus albus]